MRINEKTSRALISLFGLAISVYGFRRAGMIGRFIGVFGLSLLSRAVSNPQLKSTIQKAGHGISRPAAALSFRKKAA